MPTRFVARWPLVLVGLLPLACSPDTVAPADAAPADVAPADVAPADVAPADVAPDRTIPPDAAADAAPDVTLRPDAAPDARDAAVPDATARDAAVPDATAPDATAPDGAAGCSGGVALPEMAAPQVGASGGAPARDLACAAGEVIIGVAARMSDGDTANGSRSAVGLSIACASVTFGSGGPVVGSETPVEVMGSGAFGWTPATLSSYARCPPGWLVAGLRASRGPTGDQFLDLSVTCAELRPDGSLSGMTQMVYAEGSLRAGPTYDTSLCPTGQVVRRFATRVGAGFDATTSYCAAPSCGP